MPLKLIVGGFLGSGKTTLIRRIVREIRPVCRVAVVENESGRESVDGAFLRDEGLKVVDLLSGCVCCTLRGELPAAMERLRADFDPDCVILEPSGLGDLSDLCRLPGFAPDGVVLLVDVERYDLLLRMNRAYYERQFRLAPVIVLTRTDLADPQLVARVGADLARLNPRAMIVDAARRFDAAWWLSTLPEHCARFRTWLPALPSEPPRFVVESCPVPGTLSPGGFGALFGLLEARGVALVRAKGCLRTASGWVKVDWLPSRGVECSPLAGELPGEGFLTCWRHEESGQGPRVADIVCEWLNEKIQ